MRIEVVYEAQSGPPLVGDNHEESIPPKVFVEGKAHSREKDHLRDHIVGPWCCGQHTEQEGAVILSCVTRTAPKSRLFEYLGWYTV